MVFFFPGGDPKKKKGDPNKKIPSVKKNFFSFFSNQKSSTGFLDKTITTFFRILGPFSSFWGFSSGVAPFLGKLVFCFFSSLSDLFWAFFFFSGSSGAPPPVFFFFHPDFFTTGGFFFQSNFFLFWGWGGLSGLILVRQGRGPRVYKPSQIPKGKNLLLFPFFFLFFPPTKKSGAEDPPPPQKTRGKKNFMGPGGGGFYPPQKWGRFWALEFFFYIFFCGGGYPPRDGGGEKKPPVFGKKKKPAPWGGGGAPGLGFLFWYVFLKPPKGWLLLFFWPQVFFSCLKRGINLIPPGGAEPVLVGEKPRGPGPP